VSTNTKLNSIHNVRNSSGSRKRYVFTDDRAPFILEVDDETDTDLLAVLNDWMSPKGFDFATIERLTSEPWYSSSTHSATSNMLLQGYGRQVTILRRTRLLDRTRGASVLATGANSTFGLSSSLNRLFQEAYAKICYTVRNMRPCQILSLNHHINIIEDGQVEVLFTAMVHQITTSSASNSGPAALSTSSRSSTPTNMMFQSNTSTAPILIHGDNSSSNNAAMNNSSSIPNGNPTYMLSSSPGSYRLNQMNSAAYVRSAMSASGSERVLIPLIVSADDNLQLFPPSLQGSDFINATIARSAVSKQTGGTWIVPRMDIPYDLIQSSNGLGSARGSQFHTNFLTSGNTLVSSSPGSGLLSTQHSAVQNARTIHTMQNQQAYTSYSASGNNTNNTLNVSTRGREYSAASSEVAVATGNATSGLTMTVSSVELGFPTTDSITNLIGFTAEENGSALNDALMHSASQQVSQDNTPMFDSASEDFQSIAMNTSANNSTNNSTSTTRRNSLTNTGAPNLPNRLETIEESTLSMTPSLSASMSPNQTNSRTMLSIRQSSNAGVHQQNTPPISSSATSSGMPSPLPPYSRNDTSTSAINGKSCQISQQLPPTIPANLHSHPSWMMTQQQSLASSMGSSPPEDTPQSGIYQSLLSQMQESQRNQHITGLLNQVLLTPRSDIPGTRSVVIGSLFISI
jgi:hypothetical protein